MNTLIHTAQQKDLLHVQALEQDIFLEMKDSPRPLEELYDKIEKGAVLVVFVDGVIVAMCIYEAEVRLLTSFGVAADYRGQGIARKLMNAAIETYLGPLYLQVWTTNTKAVSFYSSFGFWIVRTEKGVHYMRHRKIIQ